MAHRTTPLVLLVWLLVLGVAGAFWMLVTSTPPTEFGPHDRPRVGGGEDGEQPPPPEPVWTLSGRVRQANGRGSTGARVDVDGRRAETGSDGHFEVPGLAWQEHDVAFWKEGYRLETRHVRPGDHPDVRLRLLLSLAGVVRLPGGAPLPGHRVTLRSRGEVLRETRTDESGAFSFERVAAGEYSVCAAPYAADAGAFLTTYERARAGRTEPVVLEMRPGVAFVGRVTAPDGAAVPDAVVYATMYKSGGRRTGPKTLTDEDGRFTLVVPRDQKCTVIFETPTPDEGWRYLRWFRTGVLPEDGPLDVRLEEGFAIAGRVEGARGVSVAGRRVTAYRIAGRARNLITAGFVQEDGTFRIGGLWKARYELRISDAMMPGDAFIVTPNKSITSGTSDVVLVLHRARQLAGRVLDAAGEPRPGVDVVVRRPDLGFTRTCRSGEGGRFDFPRVPPGTLHVAARPTRDPQREIDCGRARAGDTAVEIRVPTAE